MNDFFKKAYEFVKSIGSALAEGAVRVVVVLALAFIVAKLLF